MNMEGTNVGRQGIPFSTSDERRLGEESCACASTHSVGKTVLEGREGEGAMPELAPVVRSGGGRHKKLPQMLNPNPNQMIILYK